MDTRSHCDFNCAYLAFPWDLRQILYFLLLLLSN